MPTTRDDAIYAFLRRKGRDRVLVVANLSRKPHEFTLETPEAARADYTELWSGERRLVLANASLALPAWGYRVYLSNR